MAPKVMALGALVTERGRSQEGGVGDAVGEGAVEVVTRGMMYGCLDGQRVVDTRMVFA